MSSLFESSFSQLVKLYQKHPENPELKIIPEKKKDVLLNEKTAWQSYNLPLEKQRGKKFIKRDTGMRRFIAGL
ncbi:MAG TPA: hypothetical protein VNM69_04215 [Bacillus sp. (in: firmicutes)]|nr:hypothetical protein [Bacillus sp. (in: firmicutes)]